MCIFGLASSIGDAETVRNHAILQKARDFNFSVSEESFFYSFMQLNKSRIGISLEGSSNVKDNNSAAKHIP